MRVSTQARSSGRWMIVQVVGIDHQDRRAARFVVCEELDHNPDAAASMYARSMLRSYGRSRNAMRSIKTSVSARR